MTHIPQSTYRIQFNKEFTFNNLSDIVPYLASLGISDIYASPIFQARKGSMHGYDIVEPNQLNSELGSEDDYNNLVETYKKYKLNWLQDIVPNHMAFSSQNSMLVDLLENGKNSRYYNFFDIEWNHPFSRIRDRVLAPFLGKFFQDALESGEIFLKYDEEGFSINYYDTRLPVKIESYLDILSYRLGKLRNKLGRNNPDFIKFQGILYVLRSLPNADEIDERYYQIKFVKGLLWEIYNDDDIKVFINENIKIFNGTPGLRDSFNLIDKLLSEQHFRLAYWKVANEEINYRRFFNINDLISLKMENEETFNRVHSLAFRLLKEGNFSGFRIDHVDGLYDPTQYLTTLRERAKNAYIIVEKILELHEELPDWNINGTTGYEFMNYVNGLFCKPQNERKFTHIYSRFLKDEFIYEDIVGNMKRLFINRRMAGEVERLAYLIEEISGHDRYGVDITLNGLKKALEEILTYFPIYRTYIRKGYISKRDLKYIDDVFRKVKENNPILFNEFNYIEHLIKLNFADRFSGEQKEKIFDFIMRFQQLTGPLMAKGFEDTTLYIYNRFISLNEVGGDPIKFGISKNEFHRFNKKRFKKWSSTMNASSTHDTKRGEDVRARINVISEIPELWNEKIKYWNKINRIHKVNINNRNFPDRNDEYFLYQVLTGSYPLYESEHDEFIKRIKEYIVKAVREAKVHSAWVNPNLDYENAYMNFAEKILGNSDENLFLKDFLIFQKRIAHLGIFNSLSQTLIKITSPGIPDFYQGSELWDLSLVDPDNRRPVNYQLRDKLLKEIKEFNPDLNKDSFIKNMFEKKENGQIKLFLIANSLHERNRNKNLFIDGAYIPLDIRGKFSKKIIAFARNYEDTWAVTITPRFLADFINENEIPVGKIWEDTEVILPDKLTLKNIFTKIEHNFEKNIKVADAFEDLPFSLLTGSRNSTAE